MTSRSPRASLASVALLLVVFGGACSDTLLAEDYTTACSGDAECVAVLVGDMCECACTLGAINVSDLERYQEDRADIDCSAQCEPCDPPGDPVCASGKCAIALP